MCCVVCYVSSQKALSKLGFVDELLPLLGRLPRAMLIDLNVDGIGRKETPDVHLALLSVTEDTTNGLSLTSFVLVVGCRQERAEENCMISNSEVTMQLLVREEQNLLDALTILQPTQS
jgi:hypothetical protein